MLHHDMREAEMIAGGEDSHFYRTDDQYKQFLADTEFTLSLYRNYGERDIYPIWHGEWSR